MQRIIEKIEGSLNILISASLLLTSLLLNAQILWASHDVLRRHDCGAEPFVPKSDTLVFKGRFESFEESPSPRILDSSREEMIRFECEDIPILFYIPQDAKAFLEILSKGDHLLIYGHMAAFLEGRQPIIVVDAVEQVSE